MALLRMRCGCREAEPALTVRVVVEAACPAQQRVQLFVAPASWPAQTSERFTIKRSRPPLLVHGLKPSHLALALALGARPSTLEFYMRPINHCRRRAGGHLVKADQ